MSDVKIVHFQKSKWIDFARKEDYVPLKRSFLFNHVS